MKKVNSREKTKKIITNKNNKCYRLKQKTLPYSEVAH